MNNKGCQEFESASSISLVDLSPWPIFVAMVYLLWQLEGHHICIFSSGGLLLLTGFALLHQFSCLDKRCRREGTFAEVHIKKYKRAYVWGCFVYCFRSLFFLAFFWAFFHSSLPRVWYRKRLATVGLEILQPFQIPL